MPLQVFLAVKDVKGVISGERKHALHKGHQFVLGAVHELLLTAVNGGENEVVGGHANVNDVGEVDCSLFVAEEFHIFHFLGLHYYISKFYAKLHL